MTIFSIVSGVRNEFTSLVSRGLEQVTSAELPEDSITLSDEAVELSANGEIQQNEYENHPDFGYYYWEVSGALEYAEDVGCNLEIHTVEEFFASFPNPELWESACDDLWQEVTTFEENQQPEYTRHPLFEEHYAEVEELFAQAESIGYDLEEEWGLTTVEDFFENYINYDEIHLFTNYDIVGLRSAIEEYERNFLGRLQAEMDLVSEELRSADPADFPALFERLELLSFAYTACSEFDSLSIDLIDLDGNIEQARRNITQGALNSDYEMMAEGLRTLELLGRYDAIEQQQVNVADLIRARYPENSSIAYHLDYSEYLSTALPAYEPSVEFMLNLPIVRAYDEITSDSNEVAGHMDAVMDDLWRPLPGGADLSTDEQLLEYIERLEGLYYDERIGTFFEHVHAIEAQDLEQNEGYQNSQAIQASLDFLNTGAENLEDYRALLLERAALHRERLEQEIEEGEEINGMSLNLYGDNAALAWSPELPLILGDAVPEELRTQLQALDEDISRLETLDLARAEDVVTLEEITGRIFLSEEDYLRYLLGIEVNQITAIPSTSAANNQDVEDLRLNLERIYSSVVHYAELDQRVAAYERIRHELDVVVLRRSIDSRIEMYGEMRGSVNTRDRVLNAVDPVTALVRMHGLSEGYNNAARFDGIVDRYERMQRLVWLATEANDEELRLALNDDLRTPWGTLGDFEEVGTMIRAGNYDEARAAILAITQSQFLEIEQAQIGGRLQDEYDSSVRFNTYVVGVGIVIVAAATAGVAAELAPVLLPSFLGESSLVVFGVEAIVFTGVADGLNAWAADEAMFDPELSTVENALHFGEEVILTGGMFAFLRGAHRLYLRGLRGRAQRQLIREGMARPSAEAITVRTRELSRTFAGRSGALAFEYAGFTGWEGIALGYEQIVHEQRLDLGAIAETIFSDEAMRDRALFLLSLKVGGALVSPITVPLRGMARDRALAHYQSRIEESDAIIRESGEALERYTEDGSGQSYRDVLDSYRRALESRLDLLNHLPEELRNPQAQVRAEEALEAVRAWEAEYLDVVEPFFSTNNNFGIVLTGIFSNHFTATVPIDRIPDLETFLRSHEGFQDIRVEENGIITFSYRGIYTQGESVAFTFRPLEARSETAVPEVGINGAAGGELVTVSVPVVRHQSEAIALANGEEIILELPDEVNITVSREDGELCLFLDSDAAEGFESFVEVTGNEVTIGRYDPQAEIQPTLVLPSSHEAILNRHLTIQVRDNEIVLIDHSDVMTSYRREDLNLLSLVARPPYIARETERLSAEQITPTDYVEITNVAELREGDILPGRHFELGNPDTYSRELLFIDLQLDPRFQDTLDEARRAATEHRGSERELADRVADIVSANVAEGEPAVGRRGGVVPVGEYFANGGWCRHISAALQVALQEAGISSRYVRGRLLGGEGHAWIEVDIAGNGSYSYIIDLARDIRGEAQDVSHEMIEQLEPGQRAFSIPGSDYIYIRQGEGATVWRPRERSETGVTEVERPESNREVEPVEHQEVIEVDGPRLDVVEPEVPQDAEYSPHYYLTVAEFAAFPPEGVVNGEAMFFPIIPDIAGRRCELDSGEVIEFTGRVFGQGSASTAYEAILTNASGENTTVSVKISDHATRDVADVNAHRAQEIANLQWAESHGLLRARYLGQTEVDGMTAIVTEVARGVDLAEGGVNPAWINRSTIEDLYFLLGYLSAEGRATGDFQYTVGPDGRVTLIDLEGTFGSRLPSQTLTEELMALRRCWSQTRDPAEFDALQQAVEGQYGFSDSGLVLRSEVGEIMSLEIQAQRESHGDFFAANGVDGRMFEVRLADEITELIRNEYGSYELISPELLEQARPTIQRLTREAVGDVIQPTPEAIETPLASLGDGVVQFLELRQELTSGGIGFDASFDFQIQQVGDRYCLVDTRTGEIRTDVVVREQVLENGTEQFTLIEAGSERIIDFGMVGDGRLYMHGGFEAAHQIRGPQGLPDPLPVEASRSIVNETNYRRNTNGVVTLRFEAEGVRLIRWTGDQGIFFEAPEVADTFRRIGQRELFLRSELGESSLENIRELLSLAETGNIADLRTRVAELTTDADSCLLPPITARHDAAIIDRLSRYYSGDPARAREAYEYVARALSALERAGASNIVRQYLSTDQLLSGRGQTVAGALEELKYIAELSRSQDVLFAGREVQFRTASGQNYPIEFFDIVTRDTSGQLFLYEVKNNNGYNLDYLAHQLFGIGNRSQVDARKPVCQLDVLMDPNSASLPDTLISELEAGGYEIRITIPRNNSHLAMLRRESLVTTSVVTINGQGYTSYEVTVGDLLTILDNRANQLFPTGNSLDIMISNAEIRAQIGSIRTGMPADVANVTIRILQPR
ncbi:MAG: transglutaminase-like domain-containing protein [Candidatus Margulisbacteria bacterium]|nr:transglutaminase-like domain-containing protein [Candidatus Margulisiibacteriota bacterium]